MSLRKYPKYRDSGVPWLGEVPTHWQALRLKQVILCIESGVSVNAIDTPAGDGESGVLKTSCVYGGEFAPSENKSVVPEELDRLACPVKAGTLIVSRMNTPDLVGAAGVVRQNYASLFLPDRLWQVHFKDARPEFIHFWSHTRSYRAQVESACAGTSSSMQNLSQDEFRNFVLALPSPAEQSAITGFLDLETGKIEALIAEQEKLLTLLAEKRQATISHVVTRGLNPNVTMKDSGVAWLGEVPAHWGNSKKLLDLAQDHRHSFVNGPFGSDLLTSELVSEGVPVIYIRDIKPSGYLRVSEWCVTPEKAEQLKFCNVIPGDVLVAKVGDPPGLAAVYPHGEVDGIVTQDVIRLRVDRDKASAEYVRWLLNSKYGQTQIDHISVESTRTRVGLGEYKQLRFFVPPLHEQTAIVNFLDAETAKLDNLKAAAIHTIELLKERRSALIAAAVTGKIDVREAVPEELAA